MLRCAYDETTAGRAPHSGPNGSVAGGDAGQLAPLSRVDRHHPVDTGLQGRVRYEVGDVTRLGVVVADVRHSGEQPSALGDKVGIRRYGSASLPMEEALCDVAVDLSGRPFDPEVAEAVAHEPGTGGDVTVAEVLRTGYQWKGKTLRPAMVRTTD